MAAAASEQIKQDIYEQSEVLASPLVIVVPEMAEDEFSRWQAERLIRFAGHTAVHKTLEIESLHANRPRNLMEAIHRAAEGDEESLELVMANVSADGIERTIKAGHVMSVELAVDAGGKIWQHGQMMDGVHQNTLRYASSMWQMRERAEPEARNSVRIENLNRQGLLREYYFVVWSRAASDTMDKAELTEAGFFDTMSCAIQATTANGAGLDTESAFVAGVKELGGEQHDEQTVISVAAKLSVDYAGKSTAEIIDTPMLIHKTLMPHGVIDLVKLYDDAAGGTFFGEAKPRQDYLEYLDICKQRTEQYLPKIQQSMGELLAEAAHIKTPVQAIRRLHKIVEKNMLQQSIYDKQINPLVFGEAAAPYIEQARLDADLGNMELARVATMKALRLAKSASCPNGLGDEEAMSDENGEQVDSQAETWHGGKKHYNTKCRSCYEVKSVVGACFICKDCVNNPRKMQTAYSKEKAEKVVSNFARIISLSEKSSQKAAA